jgi:hypothetical protein
MKVRILPDAESDLSRAADFYDAQRDGTGDYFIACLATDIEASKIHAGVHERQHGLPDERNAASCLHIGSDICFQFPRAITASRSSGCTAA